MKRAGFETAALRFLLTAAAAVLLQLPARALSDLAVTQDSGTDLVTFKIATAGKHTLEIDDGQGFVTPLMTRSFDGDRLDLHANEIGLIPGISYHIRLDEKRESQDLRLVQPIRLDARVDCATLRNTWEATGRIDVGKASSGLNWMGDHWEIVPHSYLLGEHLYYMVITMEPALTAARACGDIQTLDEMAQYYVIMLRQTETVGDLLKRPAVHADTTRRLKSVDPSARTFSASFGTEAGEGELYNAQWLHPAARLLRIVTLLPESSRTPAMKSFASQYAQFIAKDQLERFLFEQQMPPLGGKQVKGRVASWNLVMSGMKGADSWDTAMSDIDLWLLASTSEILGAHANDPVLVPIDGPLLEQLRSAIATGIRFFQSKRTDYRDTRNFKGEIVGSASYFNGDYAAHPDMAFSAVSSSELPTGDKKKSNPNASWDISHTYRLPIFLRALYENRKALGSEFPKYRDLQLVTNQYMYRVFTGDFSRPQFKNFFDGSDGWLRVDFNGVGTGNPPSDFCDMHNPKRLCLIPGAILGWPELAFANSDLATLQRSLVDLAFVSDPSILQFRDRYLFWNSPYKVIREDGRSIYGGALYLVAAENAGMILGSQ